MAVSSGESALVALAASTRGCLTQRRAESETGNSQNASQQSQHCGCTSCHPSALHFLPSLTGRCVADCPAVQHCGFPSDGSESIESVVECAMTARRSPQHFDSSATVADIHLVTACPAWSCTSAVAGSERQSMVGYTTAHPPHRIAAHRSNRQRKAAVRSTESTISAYLTCQTRLCCTLCQQGNTVRSAYIRTTHADSNRITVYSYSTSSSSYHHQ